jgi:hypothetical protein
MKKNNLVDPSLFKEIRELVLSARNAVVRNINTVQVITNIEIGRRIVEYEQKGENRAEYGKALLKDLSGRLTKEFGRGFSERNLDYMRNFYLLYKDRLAEISQMPSAKLDEMEKSQAPSGQLQKTRTLSAKLCKPVFSLSWSQYVFLVGIKDKNALEAVRAFYNYLKARKLEKAFELLSDNFVKGYSFEHWAKGYQPLLDTSIIMIKPDEKIANRVNVKLATKDFVDDEIVYKLFEGYWDVRQINGKWLLWDPRIRRVRDPDYDWFKEEEPEKK